MPDNDVTFTGSWKKNAPPIVTPPTVNPPAVNPPATVNPPEDPADEAPETPVSREPEADTPTKVTPNPATTEKPDNSIGAAAKEQGIPTFSIGGNDIPLVSPSGVGSWSLIDLALMLIAFAFALYATISVAKRRKYLSAIGEDTVGKPRYAIYAIVVGIAVAAVIVFFATQDLSQSMVLADTFSPVLSVLVVANVILTTKVLPKLHFGRV
jgi:hypothetical protein